MTIQFPTVHTLADWLTDQGIDLSPWGQGKAKTVENLWQELRTGDSVLTTDPPRRQVSVAVVLIERHGRYLIETTQQFADGRTRPLHWPPSEKLRPGETPQVGALRCLHEELDIPTTAVRSVNPIPEPATRRGRSDSYPGLETEYFYHLVRVDLGILPPEPFTTSELEHNQLDPVVQHVWSWAALPPIFSTYLERVSTID